MNDLKLAQWLLRSHNMAGIEVYLRNYKHDYGESSVDELKFELRREHARLKSMTKEQLDQEKFAYTAELYAQLGREQ